MAERLENVDLRSFPPRNQASTHPWAEWMDGVTATSERTLGVCWRLSAPQDFDTDPEHFRRMVHGHARRGLRGVTRTVPGSPSRYPRICWVCARCCERAPAVA